ncbi:branched-chain amino acid transport system permease protein [Rhodoligotrophos appendicifer]|uniref:branched-chain amino acid ABC transporter permease n=1 Tax=Rhodoligotrophos appendicifer TaxID=987056 RepID=UPI00118486F0|nr:branched-chain amino acid ABC transporter permease [Rhodoligotrophos appendicifer]
MSTPTPIPPDERPRQQWLVAALVLGCIWILPFVLGGFWLYLGAIIACYAVASLGLQLMVGLAGQLSLGHIAFVGIGAYTGVLLEKELGVPFIVASIGAALLAGFFGLLMAQLIRLSGVYFKIATFGFGIICYQLLHNLKGLTGGSFGISGIPPLEILGVDFSTPAGVFTVSAVFLTVTYVLFLRMTNSRVGRAFQALGQNEPAARSIGIPVERYKMAVITVGCIAAGWAGALIPHIYQYLSPENFTWHESLVLLIMITIGGHGSLAGAVIGTALLIIIPEYMRDLAEYKMLVYGLLLIVSMTLLPKGIAGGVDAIVGRLRARSSKPVQEVA